VLLVEGIQVAAQEHSRWLVQLPQTLALSTQTVNA
jgi:hypothetical protein